MLKRLFENKKGRSEASERGPEQGSPKVRSRGQGQGYHSSRPDDFRIYTRSSSDS